VANTGFEVLYFGSVVMIGVRERFFASVAGKGVRGGKGRNGGRGLSYAEATEDSSWLRVNRAGRTLPRREKSDVGEHKT
jgi:hypothetical protein